MCSKKYFNGNLVPKPKGLFTLMPKKILPNFGIAKFWHSCQNFGRISYIVTKIWQQTKCNHFFWQLYQNW
jgi:hypothetical protein